MPDRRGATRRRHAADDAAAVAEAEIAELQRPAAGRPPPAASDKTSRLPLMVVLLLTGSGFAVAAARLFSESTTSPRSLEVDDAPEVLTAPTAISPELPRPPLVPHPERRTGPVISDDEGDEPGTNDDLLDALERGRNAARGCPGVSANSGRVTLRFGADGAVSDVVVQAPYAGTAAEACIERAFRAAGMARGRGHPFPATAGF